MKLRSRKVLLFIHPSQQASERPVIDVITLKVAYQLTNHTHTGVVEDNGEFEVNQRTKGWHECTGCGEKSLNYDFMLPCGLATNSLAVHYIAYHRQEVPQREINKIWGMELEYEFAWDDYVPLTHR
jgi:hypothetical protein